MNHKMKSITIHGLDNTLYSMLQKRAASEGNSLNKTIKELLREYMGIGKATKNTIETRRKEFMKFYGVWTKEEAREFDRLLESNEHIDPEDWPSLHAKNYS